MKFEIEEREGKLFVTVSVPRNVKDWTDREKVNLNDITQILKENNIKHGKCLQSVKVTNRTPERSSGVFIFELPQPKLKVKPKRKRTSRTRKTTSPIIKKAEKKLDIE